MSGTNGCPSADPPPLSSVLHRKRSGRPRACPPIDVVDGAFSLGFVTADGETGGAV